MKKRLLKFVFSCILTALIVFIAVIGFKFVLPGYRLYKQVTNETPIVTMVENVRARENYTTFDKLPVTYKNAVVAVEDHGFYDHGAVSGRALLRVFLYYIKDGSAEQGGSTITQQVVKNLYFGMDQSLTRKVAEVFLAYELEKHYEKDEVLELYANCIYYGSGYYCIYDAAKGYYGVEPEDLNDFQSTVLAGVPNAPSIYSPDNNTPLTYQRQRMVVESMIKYGYLTKEQGDAILSSNG